MTMTCAELRDLAPAFVLGALGDAEMAAVREHLATCSEVHEEFAELGGVVGYLAETVEQVEPSSDLKARILAAARADRAPVAADPVAAPVVPVRPPAPAVDLGDRRARRPFAVGAWAMRLGAVLAIVALGAWSLNLQGRLDASERYAQGVASVLAAAAQPGSQIAILSGGDGGPTGIAAVSADGSIALAMRDLAPTTGSEVYEAWVIVGDGAPVALGGFTVGSDGTGTFQVARTAAVAGTTLALTREPAAGATTPTLPIVSFGVAVAPPG